MTPPPPPAPVAADPIRPWFEALEAMDEFIGIRYGRVNPETQEVEWKFLPHTDYDGIGAFAEMLREGGAQLDNLPQITHPAKLSWWPFFRHLPMMMGPRKRLKWRDIERGAEIPHNQPAPAVAWHVFTEEETAKIRRASRLIDATVNSFLLKYLDRSVRTSLADPSLAVPWMVPVNLRGKVAQPKDTENHSSYIGIRIFASSSVKDVQHQIYEALRKGQHWANWKAFSAARFTSPGAKKKLILSDRATLQWNVGSFSNLGVWDDAKQIKNPENQGPWLFAPPVLKMQHLGAGCVTFQGRLSLTLQVHPDLTTDPAIPEQWMKSWVREIKLGFPDYKPTENDS